MSSDVTAVSTEPAELVADAVRAVPGVADLHAGAFGEVATYLPGRRVTGVRLDGDDADVHVVLTWDAPAEATADAVRSAVAAHVTGSVDVTVADVAPPA